MQTAYLGLIGGLSIRSTTAAVMKAVMTTELARLFNFCGLRGKQGFSALQLKEVVCGWCCALFTFIAISTLYRCWYKCKLNSEV